MKKVISLFLALLMALSLMVLSAGAAAVPFTDIDYLDEYTQENIAYLYYQGVMNGTGATSFSPDALYTRAMFVTMLGRTAGVDPDDYPGSHFTDVSAKHWAAPYINWASENGIVNGVGDRKFNPDGIITLEQYCTIVCRFMDSITAGINYESTGSWPPLIYDLEDTSAYAVDSLITMVESGLTQIYGDDEDTAGVYVFPKQQLTRADIAYIYGDFHFILTQGESLNKDYGYAEITTWVEFG